MEQTFEKTLLHCLDSALREVQNAELTQQIPLPDGMPDIGRILSGWGQCILRSKEWMTDRVSLSAGMMVWVLYAPEDGTQPRWIDTWIPFQMKWDLPEGTEEGVFRVHCLCRFVDARSVSPRKIMIRAGAAAQVEALTPIRREVWGPKSPVEKIELLERSYPLRLRREAGEKSFALEEELVPPEHMSPMEKLVCCQLMPRVAEKKVLGDKIVFRGSVRAHLVYQGEDGKLHSFDHPLNYSQFEELNGQHSADATVEVLVEPTSLELDLDEEGRLNLKAGLTAQYSVCDRVLVNLVEDACSPRQMLSLEKSVLELPVILDTRTEMLRAEGSLPDVGQPVEIRFQPDAPRVRLREGAAEVEAPGSFQVLSYGEDGALRSASLRWEDRCQLRLEAGCGLSVFAQAQEPQILEGRVRAELPLEVTATASQSLPMVTAVKTEGDKVLDPNRPSLILRRCQDRGLWELAKDSGSTVACIRRANGLEGEPAPGQLLLIPVV